MFVCGAVAFAVSLIGVDRRLTMAVAQSPAAFLLLAATVAGAVFVSPAYWFLGASAYLRAFGLLLSPWVHDATVDWRSARARSTVAIATAAIVPILVLVTLLFYGPEWGIGMTEFERQVLFGIVVLLDLVVIGASFVAAGRLTISLRELARVIDESPLDLPESTTGRASVAEVDAVREALVGLYVRLAGQNAELERANTELERANTDLERANRELARANAAKDEFLGLVSHELKTPITSMLASAALLGRADRETRQELTEDLESEAERLAAIVDNLLVLARPDSGPATGAEPTLLLRAVQGETERFARRDPTRAFSVAGDRDIVVDAVPEQVSMVLRNFLSNAQKYSPSGSPIDVRVSQDAGMATVAVHDLGHGLTEDEVPHVFEAFYRGPSTGREAAGIGIGLTVCRRVVTAMGGDVAVSVGPDGTVFRFTLPLAAETDDEPAALSQVVAAAL
jgi:signal transduction histidine kinase